MRRFFFLLLFPLAVSAQDLSGFEKILLPAFTIEPIEGPRVLFFTQPWVYSEISFRYFPGPFVPNGAFATHPAFSPAISLHGTPRVTHGLLLFIEKPAADRVKIGYEVRVQPFDGTTHSAAPLPVARERDFLTGAATIMGVIDREVLRNHLRIYDVDGTGTMRVRVRTRFVFPTQGAVLAEQIVDVNRKDDASLVHPYFAEVLLPSCACTEARLIVELEPLDATHYYAFVSGTRNDTQQVMTYLPR